MGGRMSGDENELSETDKAIDDKHRNPGMESLYRIPKSEPVDLAISG